MVISFRQKKGDFNELEDIASFLELNSTEIVIGKQTHSAEIEVITPTNKYKDFIGIDAYITQERGICIAVKTADCTPVLLFDPVEKVIAAIHSGWRGTVQNITGKTIAEMMEGFGVNPGDIIAAIGPCIGWHNYEVGKEVAEQFRGLFPQNSAVIIEASNPNEKSKLSVRHAIHQQLIDSGIKPENIEISETCTFDNSTEFHSARRDGAQTGRMVNGIWMKRA